MCSAIKPCVVSHLVLWSYSGFDKLHDFFVNLIYIYIYTFFFSRRSSSSSLFSVLMVAGFPV